MAASIRYAKLALLLTIGIAGCKSDSTSGAPATASGSATAAAPKAVAAPPTADAMTVAKPDAEATTGDVEQACDAACTDECTCLEKLDPDQRCDGGGCSSACMKKPQAERALYLAEVAAAVRTHRCQDLATPKNHAEAVEAVLRRVRLTIELGDAQLFAALMGEEAFAILPPEDAIGRPAIEAAARRWFAAGGKRSLNVTDVHVGGASFGADDMRPSDYFVAELVDARTSWRVTGVALPLNGGYQVAAIHISAPITDAEAARSVIPPLPAFTSEAPGYAPFKPSEVTDLRKHVYPDPAVALVGSAPSEFILGRTHVAKALAGWRNLTLVQRDARFGQQGDSGGVTWAIAHLDGTTKRGSHAVTLPYRALVIVDVPSAGGADQGGAIQLLSAHFSVATPR